MLDQVEATDGALKLIEEIRADHGPVIFHQSGGCCDGSAPMCLAEVRTCAASINSQSRYAALL